jgi:hypothetical protein
MEVHDHASQGLAMTALHQLTGRLSRALALLLVATAAQAAPPLPGAIFTTLSDGTKVNANIFSAKCDSLGVYLDGGPGANAPVGAAGLPDGDYFYQVTDPSGKVLLSTDPQKYRRFTVSGGLITSRVTPAAAGDHETGLDADHGAVTVELCPFLDSPNNGGEYKVWATQVADFAGNAELVDNGYNPGYFHGFIPAASKTDNFKVKARKSVCLTILKFEDIDGNGKLDGNPLDPYLIWPVHVYDSTGAEVQGRLFTGTTGGKEPLLRVCALQPGDYTVVEEASIDTVNLYQVTANILDGKYLAKPSRTVVVKIGTNDRTLVFGNYHIR